MNRNKVPLWLEVIRWQGPGEKPGVYWSLPTSFPISQQVISFGESRHELVFPLAYYLGSAGNSEHPWVGVILLSEKTTCLNDITSVRLSPRRWSSLL